MSEATLTVSGIAESHIDEWSHDTLSACLSLLHMKTIRVVSAAVLTTRYYYPVLHVS